jgi:hypothetical protein
MAIGYRSILQLDNSSDALRVAEDQLRDWITSKARRGTRGLERADWDGPGVHILGPSARLTVLKHAGQDDRHRRSLLEYVEDNDQGIWTTRVYAMSDPTSRRYRQTLWFESEGRGRRGQNIIPSPPRIVRNTLETVDAFDGVVPILPGPRTMRGDDHADLLGYITDPERSISLVVAAPVPGVGNENWARAVDALTKETLGCATFFVLDDAAHDQLNQQLGAAHAIPSGALRTFVPGVELEDPLDARRHRVLTPATILKGLQTLPANRNKPARMGFDSRTRRLVSVSPRLHLLEKELPSELTRATRILQRLRLVLDDDVAPSPLPSTGPPKSSASEIAAPVPVELAASPPPEPTEEVLPEPEPIALPQPALGRLSDLVHRVLGKKNVDDQTLATLAERFDRQETLVRASTASAESLQKKRERLEDQVATLKAQLDTEKFERAVAESGRQAAERKTRQLEAWRASRPDRYEFVETRAPLWEDDPVSVMDIVERLTDEKGFEEVRRYVSLTDVGRAIDDAADIDVVDKSSLYATSFWEYVLVLMDYVKEVDERGFNGNVHTYLDAGDRVVGRKCVRTRHRPNESESVANNSKWRKERTFTVPTSLHPSGKMFMTAHFAPTHRDQNAPRMYYAIGKLDGSTHAHIGYIGMHLTNTRTN